MKFTTRVAVSVGAVTALLVAVYPPSAEAHLNVTGVGPVYDGMAHFLLSPEDLVSVLALALVVGLRGASYGRRALFVLPTAWLFGGLVGLYEPATNGSAVVSALWFLLLGGLVAADVQFPLLIATFLAVLLGLDKGYLNGEGLGQPETAIVALTGLTSAVFVVIALASAFVLTLRAQWARIVVRVAGSWVFAVGLLMLGWAFKGDVIVSTISPNHFALEHAAHGRICATISPRYPPDRKLTLDGHHGIYCYGLGRGAWERSQPLSPLSYFSRRYLRRCFEASPSTADASGLACRREAGCGRNSASTSYFSVVLC